jgi:hypothetical protein
MSEATLECLSANRHQHRRTGRRESGKNIYRLLINRALADSPFVVVVGEHHAEGIQFANYYLPVAFGNLHFKLRHHRTVRPVVGRDAPWPPLR